MGINFADHAALLEVHSRRARELLRKTLFDKMHPEASARRLCNERTALFAPPEMKFAAGCVDFRRNIYASLGDRESPVFNCIRTQFVDRHD